MVSLESMQEAIYIVVGLLLVVAAIAVTVGTVKSWSIASGKTPIQ